MNQPTTNQPKMPTIRCPKHGVHQWTFIIPIPAYEGHYCQLCWLDQLGKPCEVVDESELDNQATPWSAKA